MWALSTLYRDPGVMVVDFNKGILRSQYAVGERYQDLVWNQVGLY